VIGPEGVDWPFSLECKNVQSTTTWPAWLAQATRQAAGRVPVVVRKGAGVGDVGQHVTVLPLNAYLNVFDGVRPLVDRRSRTCHAELWLSRPDHPRVEWHDGRQSWAVVRFAEFCRAARA
jgi:hypothetical protein